MKEARNQKVVAVVGSQLRHWPNRLRAAARAVTEGVVLGCCPLLYDGGLVTGDAPGVDMWAYETATRFGVKVVQFAPAHRRWAPGGYEERNRKIAERCHELYVIYHPDGTYGGRWTADLAEKLGKKVARIEVK